MNLIETIELSDLNEDQQQLAELIGLESYKKLVLAFGGTYLYLPKVDTLTIENRNNKIREDFNGYNINELAIKWNLSVSRIRDIVDAKKNEIKRQPCEGQITLF